MRANELLEGYSRGKPVVCVDVQPAYTAYTDPEYVDGVVHFLSRQQGPIMMYVNAEDTGITEDNLQSDIIPFWHESYMELGEEFDPSRMEWFDKGYGYLRAWMDIGIEDKYIISVIREMYKQKVYDSRMLFGGDEDKILEYLQPVAESINTEPDTLLDDPLSVGWVAVDQLKRYNNCYLIGGGRDECLKEVALLMNAFNIKYKMINELIF